MASILGTILWCPLLGVGLLRRGFGSTPDSHIAPRIAGVQALWRGDAATGLTVRSRRLILVTR
jgi:hypothetical protein